MEANASVICKIASYDNAGTVDPSLPSIKAKMYSIAEPVK